MVAVTQRRDSLSPPLKWDQGPTSATTTMSRFGQHVPRLSPHEQDQATEGHGPAPMGTTTDHCVLVIAEGATLFEAAIEARECGQSGPDGHAVYDFSSL